jgi:hypothetical protein
VQEKRDADDPGHYAELRNFVKEHQMRNARILAKSDGECASQYQQNSGQFVAAEGGPESFSAKQ